MRLAIVTGVWKRPEVFEMFAEGVKLLQSHFSDRLEIIVCVAGSEGRASQEMVRKHRNFFYTEHSNKPLGVKMNVACLLAKRFSPDYCLMMGSDDIIGIDLMEQYFTQMQKGIDYIYLMDCYFFDTVTKKGLYWGGYRKPHNIGMPAGIGRMLSRKVLEHLHWICWPVGYDKVLDTGFDKQIKRIACTKHAIWLKDVGCFALDIKSSENMTPFALWDNCDYLDGKDLLFQNLPEPLAKQIYG